MKCNVATKAPIVLAALCIVNACFADNPFVQTCYTADPAPLVYNDRVYVYVGHDSSAAPAGSYLMRDWKCYSSGDMVNWTDHGVVLKTSQFSWSGGDANAAQCVFRNGKFYYYVSTSASGTIAIGVAVATNPLGPFTDIGQPLLSGDKMTGCNATHGWRGLDPTVFTDTDGKAYLYTGNNALYWVTLNNDMTSFSGSVSCLAANTTASFGPDYEEAPWFYRRNNIYYLVYASQFPETIRYATGSNPLGPWTYKGQIMASQPDGVSNTIHPGVCDFAGNSYFFYHNAGLPGGGSYKRSVCVEQFEYNSDGTIPTIRETAAGVVKGVNNLDPYDTTQAETICFSSGVSTVPCSEGGIAVDSIQNGDYIKVEGVDFKAGAASFDARVASGSTGGAIELHLDSQTGPLVGTCAVAGTGGWQKWETKTCAVSGVTGVHDLYLKFTGGSGLLFNFNWWKFDPVDTTGIGTGLKNGTGWRQTMEIRTNNGKNSTLRFDFLQRESPGKVHVSLFTLSGKRIARLLCVQQQSSNPTLFPNRMQLRPGVYLIRVSTDDNVLYSKAEIIN
jgi:arabinoxylan arabinofuranohydrolase